jgi:metacaspase-1
MVSKMNLALLVGVNNYQTPGNDLRGCVNDVGNMRQLLTNGRGFAVPGIKTMINDAATKERILKELTHLVTNMKQGDHGVFHFSGHGSQVPSTSEPDGMDEILCPYDFDSNGTYITDDEIHAICDKLDPDATLDILLDSCHSGDMLREGGAGIPRFIPPPFPLGESKKVRELLSGHGFENVALWSGCRSSQTSADAFIKNQYQGAFTWAFCQAIGVGGHTKRERIHNLIAEELEAKGYEQSPQLECSEEMKARGIFL